MQQHFREAVRGVAAVVHHQHGEALALVIVVLANGRVRRFAVGHRQAQEKLRALARPCAVRLDAAAVCAKQLACDVKPDAQLHLGVMGA